MSSCEITLPGGMALLYVPFSARSALRLETRTQKYRSDTPPSAMMENATVIAASSLTELGRRCLWGSDESWRLSPKTKKIK